MAISFFKKKKKTNNGVAGAVYYTVTVLDIVRETEDAISIVFNNPENQIQYKPGQYITLIVNIEGEEMRRSYSLSSSPDYDQKLSVAVKEIDEGKVSKFLVNRLKPGDELKIMAPAGNFTTELNERNARTFVLFAGGSGITPLMSIMKSVLIAEPKSDILLVYQNRNEESVIYDGLIRDLIKEYGDRIRVKHVLSQPSDAWQGMRGRLSADQIESIFSDENISREDLAVFICGPGGMMETVETTLDHLGIDKKKRFKESFYSSKTDKENGENLSEVTATVAESTVTIILDHEEHEIKVRNKEFILETALDSDINMPFSCQSGICTSCRGKLLEGKVTMEEPEGLSDEELEEGYILTCVSHPASDHIKIEMG